MNLPQTKTGEDGGSVGDVWTGVVEDSVVELNGTDNYEGISVHDFIDYIEQANSDGDGEEA